jgi:hypothetical protein
MPKQDRTYRRTDAGRRASENERSGLPAAYRRILAAVERLAHPEEILARLPGDDPQEVLSWLDEMESLGFVECSSPLLADTGYVPVRRGVAFVPSRK